MIKGVEPMERSPKTIINELLVEVFNQILSIQQEHLRGLGVNLSMNEIHVLEAINKTEESTMSHVAKKLRVTVGTLTTSVNRLVEKGYVERFSKSTDKRKVFLRLTDQASQVLNVHDTFHEDMINSVIKDMKLEENEVLINSLQKLNEYFKQKY